MFMGSNETPVRSMFCGETSRTVFTVFSTEEGQENNKTYGETSVESQSCSGGLGR